MKKTSIYFYILTTLFITLGILSTFQMYFSSKKYILGRYESIDDSQIKEELSKEEYEIFSHFLQTSKFQSSNGFLIINETTQGSVKPKSSLEDVVFALNNLPSSIINQEIVRNYQISNQNSVRFSDEFNIKKLYKVVEKSSLKDSLFQDGTVIRFSRIGFDTPKKRAVFYYEYFAGPKNAGGEFVTFTNENGEWKKVENFVVWVS
jgi:hypothetical protein